MAIEVPAWAKKKVGPLPVGAWVLIGGVGVGAVLYYRKKRLEATGGGYPFNENAADNVYGVPVDSPEDSYYGDVPASAPPSGGGSPGTGGFVWYPPTTQPAPGQEVVPSDLPVAQPQGCIEETLPARMGAYTSAPNRECPNGWHVANQGPCRGKCVRNKI